MNNIEELKSKKPENLKSRSSVSADYVTDDNTGGYFVVECGNCGEVFPSQKLDGGGAIADSGDYGDAYCPHCNETDPDECANVGLVWNVQQAKINALIAQLEAAQKELFDFHNQEFQQRLANAEHQLYMKDLAIHNIKASRKAQFRKRLAAEAALSAANEKLNQVITDDWNEIGPTYPAHYTPVIVAMNGVTQYITYQIEEGDNGDYWQPVCNEDGEGAPITQFQHWKPLPADFVVEGNADAE
ncbi:hypothetical protein LH413_16490 [Yersinia massiliensis]|uniref:hypothetical protein n=1 Tax=Yersinia massiliensis TaxID=419257 RepID=UPI001CFF0FC3|nr:hypothetical protein [Yersinia massiliensis]MCB5319094.1 hypothetical protein [Yersinia massiliensis]